MTVRTRRAAEALLTAHGDRTRTVRELAHRDSDRRARGAHVVEIVPAPLDADTMTITGGEPSAANLDVRFTPGPLTRAHLYAVFGAGATREREPSPSRSRTR